MIHFRSIIVTLSLLSAPAAAAQEADPAMIQAERDAIAKLSWMDGAWRGDAATQGAGGTHRVVQTDRVGNLLGGTVKVIEGKGFNPGGEVGFNALAVLSWDPPKQSYGFRSYAQGRSGDFSFTPTATGYVWEIPAGPMTIRYTATFDRGVWHEVGDRILSGQPPQRFFEMNLKRIGDSPWPAQGGLTAH